MLDMSDCEKRGCKHYRGITAGPEVAKKGDKLPTQAHFCEAFPGGIPDEIAYGPNLHTEPFPGDRGIQFEKDESKADE